MSPKSPQPESMGASAVAPTLANWASPEPRGSGWMQPALLSEAPGQPDPPASPAEPATQPSLQPAAPIPERPPVARRPPPAPDSAWRTMIGLVVVWGALMMVFMAHSISEKRIELTPHATSADSHTPEQVSRRELRSQMLGEFSFKAPDTSPMQALLNVAQHVGLTCNEARLRELGLSQEAQTLVFEARPLYKVIHSLLGTRGLGLALRDREMIIFPQELELDPAAGPDAGSGPSLAWKADLPLDAKPLLIFPSGEFDVWFSLSLSGGHDQPEVAMEVWNGSDNLAASQTQLNANGYGLLNLAMNDTLALQIQRKPEPAESDPSGSRYYQLQFHYQAFQ